MAEEIGFENGRNSNFQGLVTLTLTLDPAIRIPSCITHRPTYQISFKSKKLFVDGRTDVRTYVPTYGHFLPLILSGRLLEVDLKIMIFPTHNLFPHSTLHNPLDTNMHCNVYKRPTCLTQTVLPFMPLHLLHSHCCLECELTHTFITNGTQPFPRVFFVLCLSDPTVSLFLDKFTLNLFSSNVKFSNHFFVTARYHQHVIRT